MKQVRIFILLVCLSSATLPIVAQTSYVEVTVTDTVLAKADYFVFRINVVGDYSTPFPTDTTGIRTDPAYYSRQAERLRVRQQESAKLLEQRLKRAGFLFEPLGLSDLAYRNNAINNFIATTHSLAALDSLTNIIKTEKGVNANLVQISSVNEEADLNRLTKKLLAKAKERANLLAAQTGKKIGAIISVTDKRSEAPLYMATNITYINSFFIDRQAATGNSGINPSYPIPNGLVVRFAWQ